MTTSPPPATPSRRILTRGQTATMSREYVTAGPAALWGRTDALAGLPSPFDDLTSDFGTDIYDQMLLDAQAASAVVVLKVSILEDGATVAPSISDRANPQFALASEIADAASTMVTNLQTPLDDVLWQVLEALTHGHCISEIVCELVTLDGRRRLDIVKIKPKSGRSVSFVVDAYLNVIGFLVARPGQALTGGTGSRMVTDSTEVLPRDKFAVLTWRPRHGDPRGTSILRPAYEAWWRKRQMTPEYLKYLTQFAGPSLWGSPPPGADAIPDTDPLGNLLGPDGQVLDAPDDAMLPAPLTPADMLLQALLDFRNGTAMTAPAGTEIHPIEMQGNGEPFLRCFAECDRAITHAILGQELATEEGEHMARAAATVHQDVLDTLVRQAKNAVTRMLEQDILKPWVTWNWGPDAARDLTPHVTLGTTERRDLSQLMNAVAALARSGYLHPSQRPGVDRMLSLPIRDDGGDDDSGEAGPGHDRQQVRQPDSTAPAPSPGGA